MVRSSASAAHVRFLIFFLLACLHLMQPGHVRCAAPWEDLGLYGGQITAVVVHPEDPTVLFAGSWGGNGLFTTTDSGLTWRAVPSDNASWFKNCAVFDIDVNPHDPRHIWVANADYVDVSFDAGASWQSLDFAAREGRFCFTVAVDPHDRSGCTVYVGTGGPRYTDMRGCVYKTTDRGVTWDKTRLVSDFNVYDLQLSPTQPDEIWAACNTYQISPNGQICISSDGGLTWTTWRFASYIDELAVHPAEPGFILAAGQMGVMIRDDPWTQLEPAALCTALCIPGSSPARIYASMTDTIAVSDDYGKTWRYRNAPPGRFFTLCTDQHDELIAYGGHLNRGVFKTTDGAMTWSGINSGIQANAVFSTDVSPHDHQTILAGTLAGVFQNTNRTTWELINRDPATAVTFHPNRKETLVAGFDWQLGTSTDGGATWSYTSFFGRDTAYGISSIAIAPELPEYMYVGVFFYAGDKGCIMKSTDGGMTFQKIFEAPSPVNCVLMHPADPGIIYAGTGNFHAPVSPGALHKSTDCGRSWNKTSLTGVVVNDLAAVQEYPYTIYAACGAYDYSYGGIFSSTDGGTTWDQKACGLPSSPALRSGMSSSQYAATDIHIDAGNHAILYAALYDLGLYASFDAGSYWTQIGLSDFVTYTLCAAPAYHPAASYPERQPVSMSRFQAGSIIAGTSSGIYQYAAAGTGMLSGIVASAETGEPIDAAVISSSHGSACLSAEGYYVLVLAEGTHNLSASAAGFLTTVVSGITVGAGQAHICNIELLPESGVSTCIARTVINSGKQCRLLAQLHAFKDAVLYKTHHGRGLIDLYYRTGSKIEQYVLHNPSVHRRLEELIFSLFPELDSTAAVPPVKIPSRLVPEIDCMLQEALLRAPCSEVREVHRVWQLIKKGAYDEIAVIVY